MIKKKDKYLLDDKEIVKKQSYKRGDIKKKIYNNIFRSFRICCK